jgi:ABC-2 type transport system permease protein
MRALLAVYKRETALMFRSITGYAIAAGVLFFVGAFFMSDLAQFATGLPEQGGGFTADIALLRALNVVVFLLFLIAPLLAMRLLSEETREGTLEILMTLPIGDVTFITGKFLAAWTFYTFMIGLTALYIPLLLGTGAVMDGQALAFAYLGAWLYGGVCIAVSLIWSAVTEEQIVAAFLGAATNLVLYLADQIAIQIAAQPAVSGLGEFIRQLGYSSHYQNTLLRGTVRAEDLTYFVLMIVACLFITTMLVSVRRWRAN